MLQKLIDVSRRLAHPSDLTETLEEIIRAGQSAMSADRGSVFLLDHKTNELFSRVTSDGHEIRFPASKGIAGETLTRGKVLRIDDVYQDPRFNQAVDRQTGYRTKSLISVPLIGIDDRAVGVMQLLNASRGHFDEEDERLAEMFGSLAAIGIQRAQSFEDRVRKAKLEADIEVARTIQMNLLPKELPVFPGYEIATYFQPADETGGDIYDVFQIDRENGEKALALLLADATGHGIGAAVSVTQVRSMMRMAARVRTNLDEFCKHLNNQLHADLPISKFVTAFVGRLEPADHTLHYHAMGQAPLLHFHAASGECEWHNASSVPLGLIANPPIVRPKPILLEPGDLFAVLSDGFFEYADATDEEFGRDGVAAAVLGRRDLSANQITVGICKDLWKFAQQTPQNDDLTALVLKRIKN